MHCFCQALCQSFFSTNHAWTHMGNYSCLPRRFDFDHQVAWRQRGLLTNRGLPFLWTLQGDYSGAQVSSLVTVPRAYRPIDSASGMAVPRPYRPIHFVLFIVCCRLATLLFRVPLCYAARISIHVAAVSVLAGKVMTRIGSLRLCGLCGSSGPGGGVW
jgi:hypothetical protein